MIPLKMMSSVPRYRLARIILVALVVLLSVGSSACHSVRTDRSSWRRLGVVRRVRCVYELKPWLSVDRAGDRDPEGIRYRVFLDTGSGRGVLRAGTFHIELYKIDWDDQGRMTRTLASDWHYPTSAVHTIARPGMLGDGYFLHLRWAAKDIAGHEIEIITQFKDPEGNIARSGTKRLRVPKYSS